MKIFKLEILLLIIIFIIAGVIHAFSQEISFNKTTYTGVKKLGTVDFSKVEDPYLPLLQSLEAPSVSGNGYKHQLAKFKADLAISHPKNNNKSTNKRSFVNPPLLLGGFQVKGVDTGSPIDNHLAMSNEWIVTAGNFYLSVENKIGGNYKKLSLGAFAAAAQITSQAFDPRLAYDPVADRYILTFLAGFDSQNTDIILVFSETNDPRGKWNIYSITGNPNMLDQWTDYPMISLTNDEVIITINLLKDNETWQAGFIETVIWEINKSEGYNDEDLVINKYDGITYGGANIRNLCPAESATEELFDDVYFISSRNFAVENDSFFLVKLNPKATDPLEQIDIKYVLSDQPYGNPPNAAQKVGELQTNDARVLEAFRLNNHMQFVGNTRNLDNNQCGIYHGIIEDVSNPSGVILNHIIGDNYEIGYPGITYTGESIFEKDAIINFNHTSLSKNPGVSALYSIPEQGYSQIIEVGAGTTYIDMFPSDPLERWGDYSGSQRDYNNPTEVWICGYMGAAGRTNAPYVGHLSKPSEPTATINENHPNLKPITYPNPTNYRINIEFDTPQNYNTIVVTLNDILGNQIDQIYNSDKFITGKSRFSFNVESLPTGTYIAKIIIDGELIAAEKFVK